MIRSNQLANKSSALMSLFARLRAMMFLFRNSQIVRFIVAHFVANNVLCGNSADLWAVGVWEILRLVEQSRSRCLVEIAVSRAVGLTEVGVELIL